MKRLLRSPVCAAVFLFTLLPAVPAAYASEPDVVVQKLYAAHDAGFGPFFQTDDRQRVDLFFSKDLAALIWKDAVDSKGEVGAIDFDPLYDSQDPDAKNLRMVTQRGHSAERAVVRVTFESWGKKKQILFELVSDGNGSWKIDNIRYPDSKDVHLRGILAPDRRAGP